jgi:hypothetical protein
MVETFLSHTAPHDIKKLEDACGNMYSVNLICHPISMSFVLTKKDGRVYPRHCLP